jgi:hypothetical protein
VLAVQVLVPFQSSVEASVLEPLEPPVTSTCPFSTSAVDSRVAVWAWRAAVIVPADDQLPMLTPGSKRIVVASVVEPFLPPVTRIFPLARTVAVCPSRGPLDSEFSVLNADCTGSNR